MEQFYKRLGCGRNIFGYWIEPFDPGDHAKYITEATPWVYTWFVPHDINGVINLMNGREKAVKKLDAFFDSSFYAHDNEPSHQITYLYNYASAPRKTQQRVREAMHDNYTTLTGDLSGNNEAG